MNRLLFVCMGNICRSPLAEVVARAELERQGLADAFAVESRGTHAYHAGHPADPRAVAVAARSGLDLGRHQARQVSLDDFRRGDLLLVMDRRNLSDVRARAPAHAVGRIRLLMGFADPPTEEVPDPYYGEIADFQIALQLITRGVQGLTSHLLRLHSAGALTTE